MQRIINNHFLYIYIAYVNWPNDIKKRPALIMSKTADSFNIFRITSKFPNQKSKLIGKNYLIINQWKQAGLNEPSCIDTTRTYEVNKEYIMKHVPIGKLSSIDTIRLFQFLVNKTRSI